MMVAFNVPGVDLSSFGYREKVSLNDLMAQLFRSKTYTGTDLRQVKDILLPYFQNLDAYPNAQAVEKALDDYYQNPSTSPKSSTIASTVASTTSPSTLITSTTPATATSTTADYYFDTSFVMLSREREERVQVTVEWMAIDTLWGREIFHVSY
jgi:hypothetical protein